MFNWAPLDKPRLAVQSEAWKCPSQFLVLRCGRGSGKTELARRRIARYMISKTKHGQPGVYAYCLPTIAQARKVAWEPIKALFPKEVVAKCLESTMTIETVFGNTLYLFGMDERARAEGLQYDGVVVDEASDQPLGVVDKTFMPALTARNGWLWLIGVPKRKGKGAADYKKFCDMGEKGEDGWKTLSWSTAAIVSAETIKRLSKTLDAKDAEEQYGGTWTSMSGGIFHAFGSHNISDRAVYDETSPIIVGSDFNVDPMCWVLSHRYGGSLITFDEIFLRDTNTPATLDHLYAKYGSHKAGWSFFGDASGRARKTSASLSDYAHIFNDVRFSPKEVNYALSNPLIVDRFAATNRLLKNAAGEVNWLINPKCEHLINDLSVRSYKSGTMEPDDGKDIGHITDAAGYPIYALWPVDFDSPVSLQIGTC